MSKKLIEYLFLLSNFRFVLNVTRGIIRETITTVALIYATSMNDSVVCLFDVDGTLTKPRNIITDCMLECLLKLSSKIPLAVVSGSDFPKVSWQIGQTAVDKFSYVFSENGLVVHRHGRHVNSTNIVEYVGEDILQDLINFALHYMSNLRLPKKRGNFIEFRNGLINICPIGRSCSQEERDEFAQYDAEHKIREKFVNEMRLKFHSSPLQFAIGGQISIDVFPKGVQHHSLFGDRTEERVTNFMLPGLKWVPADCLQLTNTYLSASLSCHIAKLSIKIH
ncbi:unnamed protein product [Heterobilharzia americana]|nr:unnamed protein product [Heterobilharzia americana]